MQHQSQQGEGEGSNAGELIGSGAAGEDTWSENGRDSSKDTYTTSKVTSTKTSSTSTQTSQFSFRKPDYNTQPHQSYYRNNNSSRYRSRSRTNRSGWQSGGYSSYKPSYQSWTGSNSAEDEDKENYTEEEEAFIAQVAQIYRPQSAPVQQIDPEVTLERICNWLKSILRKPDLAVKLARARLELGKDENGQDTATLRLGNEGIDPRSFSLEYKSLIRMAFSTEVRRGYKLQIGSGQVVVPLE
jgi:hypothetical protein